MNLKQFFGELQRRNVYRVAVAYAVVSWLLIQIATQVFPFFEIPDWGVRLIILAILFGFPVALIFAWAYELTPEGLKRTEEVPASASITRSTGRKLDFTIIGVLLAVVAVLILARYWPDPVPADTGLPDKSIAVLPFENLSAEPANAYFADAIQGEILTRLAQIADLKVISRTSTQRYKSTPTNLLEIAKQLGVAHILEGSVQKVADRIRINVQLIDARTDRSRWAETYNRKATDILEVESEVAQKVAQALNARLTGREIATLQARPTENHAAYVAYLQGRHFLNKRTVESIQKARDLFAQAVAEDPGFALGHAGLADAYILLGKIGAMAGTDAAALAWPEVSFALAYDDQLAEGYISRAILLTDFEWNWAAAESDYKKALELSPNNAAAHQWYGRHLAQLGRAEEAWREITSAEQQDPLSAPIRVSNGKVLVVGRQYEQAVAACQKAIEFEPDFASAYSILAQAYAHLGRHADAIAAAQKYVELSGGTGWAKLELAYAYTMAGNEVEADRIVQEVTTSGAQFSPYDMATIRAARNDPEGALHWLHRAIDQRSVDVIWVRVDPRVDNVRSHPGFQKVLDRLVPRR